MIKADIGYWAKYDGGDRPVIAWGDGGEPMVLGPKSHTLVDARAIIGFKGVRHDEDAVPIVGAVPGQGWVIRSKNDDGTFENDPVVAFIIRENGYADALTASADGLIEVNEQVDGADHRLTPPGGWPGDAERENDYPVTDSVL